MGSRSTTWLQQWASSVCYGTSYKWRTVPMSATRTRRVWRAVIATTLSWKKSPLSIIISCMKNLLSLTHLRLHWWSQPQWRSAPSVYPAGDDMLNQPCLLVHLLDYPMFTFWLSYVYAGQLHLLSFCSFNCPLISQVMTDCGFCLCRWTILHTSTNCLDLKYGGWIHFKDSNFVFSL